MPQVDLETFVSACSGGSCDNKISCETLASSGDNPPKPSLLHLPPDSPPDSFCLSRDDEFDWFDRNAFFGRKDSTKANSNSSNLNPNINPISSHSQRFSNLKAKPSIIGLPKPQKSCFVEAKNRRNCKPSNPHFFPKRSAAASKSGSSVIEPSSPKVSCMGRVRSRRDRSRRLRNRQRSTGSETKKEKQERKHKTGLLASFKAIFRSSSKHTANYENDSALRKSSSRKSATVMKKTHDIRDRLPASDRYAPPRKSFDRVESAASEPVGLGGMKRFASGRRSEEWEVSVDVA